MMFLLQSFLLLSYYYFYVNGEESNNNNIIFIYVDDVGFNDFGFNQNTLAQTPFIDNLVSSESLKLFSF